MLKVYVTSFSYRSGIPEDTSGNGGGFVFDCRGLHNPGRYDEYKTLNGKDEKVIEFLKTKSEADEFLQDTWKVIMRSIKEYQKRGFENLMVNYGCTGGQHRSVYCAETTGKYLESVPGIEVGVRHIEMEKKNIL